MLTIYINKLSFFFNLYNLFLEFSLLFPLLSFIYLSLLFPFYTFFLLTNFELTIFNFIIFNNVFNYI